jgi:hypothetical protein
MCRFFLTAVLFGSAFGSLPGILTPTPADEKAHFSITRRDGAAPTIDLGNIQKYVFDGNASQSCYLASSR